MSNFTFQLPHIPQTVVIFGCGGTGSRIVPAVAQLMSTVQTLINPEMVLVDFDEVEEKNLSRQNFAKSDVGKNKAEALASRYSKAFNIKITPISVAAGTKEYDDALEMFNLRQRLSGPALYIIAVDSAEARRQILTRALRVQHRSENCSVVIDCGNEDIFGQVSFFTTGRIRQDVGRDLEFVYNWYQGFLPGGQIIPELPVDVEYYATMQEGQSTKSCADLDQTLAINNLMAAQAIAMTQNLLMGKPMNYFRVNFDLFHGVSYDPISAVEVVKRCRRDTLPANVHSFRNALESNLICAASRAEEPLATLMAELEDEMMSDNPIRYETAKMISSSLGNPKFTPSLMMKDHYPEYYEQRFVDMWNTGFEKPVPREEDVRTYNICMEILQEMQAEVASQAAQSA